MLRLYTFGSCHLARSGIRLDALSGQRKALALLAVLAASDERGASRDTLAAQLWPDSDEEHARTSLRQLVHALRSQLAEPELLLPSAELRLNPSVITSDVAEFREALGRGDDEAAVALYVAPFLDGFYVRGAGGFERWASAERAALAHSAARTLERLAERAVARGDPREAARWWHALANMEPVSARAAAGLMRALDAAGDRAAALNHARVYEALVRQEVGAGPGAVVTELAAALRRGDPPTPVGPRATETSHATKDQAAVDGALPAGSPDEGPIPSDRRHRRVRATAMLAAAGLVATLALGGIGVRALRWLSGPPAGIDAQAARVAARMAGGPSVAVLPFANTSGDPAAEPFSDGLTDELIGALGRVPGLRVVGRTSVFALKGKRLGARAMGDTLGVAAVIEASVRRAGSRVKVSAQLVSTADNMVLWAESYDRPLSDILSTQEEIAREIATALRVQLAEPRSLALVGRSTADLEAYELYLRGRHIFYSRPDRDGTLQAARHFEQALGRDPGYARAHAGLSDVHTRLAVFGFRPPQPELARAKQSARLALELDSTLAEAHAAMGHVLCVADYDWRGAERAFRRAIALDPGYTFARLPFSMCLMSEGRFAEAIAQLDTARGADPLAPAPSNVLGRVYVSARQPELAIRHLRDALELNPQMDLAHQQLGHAYLQQGRYPEALSALQRAAALSGIRDSAQLAYAYAIAGRRPEAERIMRSMMASAPHRYVPPYHLAMAAAGLGDAHAAFRWLERAYAERASGMNTVMVTPAFDALRADVRWTSLLRRMGLPPR